MCVELKYDYNDNDDKAIMFVLFFCVEFIWMVRNTCLTLCTELKHRSKLIEYSNWKRFGVVIRLIFIIE